MNIAWHVTKAQFSGILQITIHLSQQQKDEFCANYDSTYPLNCDWSKTDGPGWNMNFTVMHALTFQLRLSINKSVRRTNYTNLDFAFLETLDLFFLFVSRTLASKLSFCCVNGRNTGERSPSVFEIFPNLSFPCLLSQQSGILILLQTEC